MSFLRHVVNVFLADPAKFVPYESFLDDIIVRFVPIIFHSFVKSISCQESTNQRLHLDNNLNQKPHLAFGKIFVIIIFLPTNRTRPLLRPLFLNSFKRFNTLLMKNMRTAKYLLLLHVQIFHTYRTLILFFQFCPIKVLCFNVFPFSQPQWKLWSVC